MTSAGFGGEAAAFLTQQELDSLANFGFDVTRPTVDNVTSTKPDGTYRVDEVVDVTVQLSEVVYVSGTPTLALETGVADGADQLPKRERQRRSHVPLCCAGGRRERRLGLHEQPWMPE